MATWPATIDDNSTGTSGSILNDAFFDQVKAYIDSLGGGAWINVPFSTANFTAAGSVWSTNASNQVTLAYAITGSTVQILMNIQGVQALSVATGELYVNLLAAGAPVCTKDAWMPFGYHAAGTNGTGLATVAPGFAYLRLLRDITGTPWPAGPGGLDLRLFGIVSYAK